MPTRVLHLIKGLGPGGAEQLLLNQARSDGPSADMTFDVAYLVPEKNHLVPAIREAGWGASCLVAEGAKDVRWLFRLRRDLSRNPVDVVHGHSPLVSALSRLMLRTLPRNKRPTSVYTEHNEWPRHHRATRLLNRLTVRLEDHVIAVSKAVRDSMPQRLAVEVLIHGIDSNVVASQKRHRDEVRSELKIGQDELVIGIVANYRKEKAYPLLLHAAATVLDHSPNLRFVAIGQGPLEKEIQDLHQRLNLGDRFQLLGYQPDATRLMSAFDIFTLSSLHEGLPVALMEAMALQLPVIATSVGGIPAALADWPAILVAPGDSRALAEAYMHAGDLIPDGTANTRMESGRFDVRSSVSRLHDIYKNR